MNADDFAAVIGTMASVFEYVQLWETGFTEYLILGSDEPIVIDVDQEASVQHVAEIMVENRVHRLFVTRAGRIEGVVTTLDMLKVIRDA